MEIFDILTKEVNEKFDKMGYDLLKSQGYDVAGARKSHKRLLRLKRVMEKRGEELTYKSMRNTETGDLLLWYELVRPRADGSSELIAKSEVLKVVYTAKVGGKDEVQET